MRDISVVLLFGLGAIVALRHVYVGALLWTWVSLMNPHKLTYGFAFSLPLALAAALVTFVSALINRRQLRLRNDPAIVMLLLWVLWTVITTAFAFYSDQALDLLIDRTLKVQLMTLICLAALLERKQIEQFIWVIAVSLGFYGIKGGIFAIGTGGAGRVWGPSGALIEGNNEIGLAIVMVVPLMNYLRLVSPHAWVRRALLAAMGLAAIAALSTQSRGAFLAISAMGVVLWLRSSKKLVTGLVIVAAGVALLSFMPASWEARMQTINTYDQDASAMGRINAWQTAVNVANDRLTGAGFAIDRGREVFNKYAPNPALVLTAHSIYFQALGEHGWIGLGLFLSLGAMSFWNASRLRRRTRNQPELRWLHELAGMIQVSMVGYAVGGAFLSLTYFDLPYYIMVILLACKFGLQEGRWQAGSVGAFGAAPAKAPGGQTNVTAMAPALR